MTESTAKKPEKNKYRSSLNLPKTSFPMKANLVQNEPASLKRWGKADLYNKVRAARAGAEPFVFHDGPPYANGSIHLGHLMNKCLKDFVVRSQTMMGKDCPYVPGWDCHGLPIEHKVMGELVESGKAEKLNTLDDDTRRMAIRRECEKYAKKFHKLHTGQMTRLLTMADYENPYLTMQPSYEGATLEVLVALLEQGLVYRALKAVHWSIANETALAEAELEYYDREDTSVFVDFEAADAGAVYDAFGVSDEATGESDEEDESEETSPSCRNQTPSFMIWTTTPWTLPANLAIAVHPRFTYALVRIDGNVTVLAEGLVQQVTEHGGSDSVEILATTRGENLLGLRYRHPFRDRAPTPESEPDADTSNCYSIVDADYVTLEDGTGLVHTAPGHGHDDYLTGLRVGLPVYSPVRGNGFYDSTVPEWLRGLDVWAANDKVVEHLRASGHLFHDNKFTHSYPHDWRSKTPVIFRATEQWFIAVDEPTKRDDKSLREMALDSVAEKGEDSEVAFVPAWGRNRMRGMLDSRPDWCISRQRSWGLPIPAFFNPDESAEPCDAVLMTPESVKAIASVVREKGSDAWFTLPPEVLLADYDPAADPDAPKCFTRESFKSLTKGKDIFDVWFESGSSWNSVMRERGLGFPVDLYLEGSDQHRGWFQLSLLPALGMTGKPPFKSVLTHGFMVNPDGRKLSKSKGDTIDELFRDYGVDVLRWWVFSLSYENDVKVGREFFDLAGESYRKVRNTLRFMLSNLSDYDAGAEGSSAALADVSPHSLDAWVLDAFQSMASRVASAFAAYDFRLAHTLIYDFCNESLSATYLAAAKDRLYCDKADAPRRLQTQAVLWNLTDGLCRLLAPVMCHTADEAYRALHGVDQKDTETCVHVAEFVTDFGVKADDAWARVMKLRDEALLAMEQSKSELGVDNPLDAAVILPDAEGALSAFDLCDLADLLGVSRVELSSSVDAPVVADLREEPRCERSWKRDGTVRERSDGGMLCDRDADALGLRS